MKESERNSTGNYVKQDQSVLFHKQTVPQGGQQKIIQEMRQRTLFLLCTEFPELGNWRAAITCHSFICSSTTGLYTAVFIFPPVGMMEYSTLSSSALRTPLPQKLVFWEKDVKIEMKQM